MVGIHSLSHAQAAGESGREFIFHAAGSETYHADQGELRDAQLTVTLSEPTFATRGAILTRSRGSLETQSPKKWNVSFLLNTLQIHRRLIATSYVHSQIAGYG
jgi:hypothetical protein